MAATAAATPQNAILVVLDDDKVESVKQPLLYPSPSLAGTIAGEFNQLNPYYQENYYGKWTSLPITMTDWVNVPALSSAPSSAVSYIQSVLSAANSDGKTENGHVEDYNPAAYKYVFIVTSHILPFDPVTPNGVITGSTYTFSEPFDSGIDGFFFNNVITINGIVNVGTLVDSVSYPPTGDGAVSIIHEFGHALGLQHSGEYYHDTCTNNPNDSYIVPGLGSCTIPNHGYGPVTIMGEGTEGAIDLNAIQKEDLGIMNSSNITTVTGPGIFTIHPIETSPSAVKLMTLNFPQGLYIEYRTPTGLDANATDNFYSNYKTLVWQRTTQSLSNSTDNNVLVDGCTLSDYTSCSDNFDNLEIGQVSHTSTSDIVRISPIIYFETVDSATNKGIAGATITLSGGDFETGQEETFVTNANAATSTGDLYLDQTYNVSVTAPGYQNLTSTAGVWNPGEVGKYTMTPTVIYLQVTSSATGQGITNATLTLTGGDSHQPHGHH